MDDSIEERKANAHGRAFADHLLFFGSFSHAAECADAICTHIPGLKYDEEVALGIRRNNDCVVGLYDGGPMDELSPFS